MAFDSLVISIAILIVVVDVPLMILIALDRLDIFRIFGNKHNVEEHRRTERESQRARS